MVASVPTRADITEPLLRYCSLVDSGTVPTDVFTEDCAADYGTRHGEIQGREALAAFFGRNHAVLRHTSHHLATIRCAPDPDHVGAWRLGSHVLAWHELSDGRRFEAFGRYDDLVIPSGGQFLIHRRRFRTYGATDAHFRFATVDKVSAAR